MDLAKRFAAQFAHGGDGSLTFYAGDGKIVDRFPMAP